MRFASFRPGLLLLALATLRVPGGHAAPFDLAGPTLEIEVSRGAGTLPIAQVPHLAAGDRISLKADLPPNESAHWLMVAAFLRGATNPPPEDWFYPCETWTPRCAREGLTLTVPQQAQQLLVFLAPQTGGAYRTLVDAVRGRPGVFVRTSQDLNQAALDHARLDAYLAAVRHLGEVDPAQLKEAVPLLSRSLAIKVDDACLGKMPVLQAPCLAQGGESLILDDGHAATLAAALTSGPASDLAMEASNTPQLKSGYYGPFIGSILDIARILDSLHTARYQYFPALTSMHGRQAALTLNAPPSFHDPKSVLVVALPAIEAPRFPSLHPVPAADLLCAGKSPLVLPVEGTAVVFATAYAHDATLRLTRKDGSSLELPAQADPARGGFVVSDPAAAASIPGGSASLHALWGFDRYEGPTFRLTDAHAQTWSLAPGESADLIVGRPNTLHLRAESTSCLDEVTLVEAAAKTQKLEWKRVHPNEVEVTLPLQDASAGELTLRLAQFGHAEAQTLTLHAFAQAAHLESFTLHAGDTDGILRGNRLDEVRQLTFGGVPFAPGTLTVHDGRDELRMLAQPGTDTHALKAEDADVTLADGRSFKVKASVESPRPSAVLISKSVQWSGAGDSAVQLTDASELPLEARLTFSIHAQAPAAFSADDKLEVATTDGAFGTQLTVSAGQVMLQSRKVALVTLDPAKTLGASAFGPLQFRRIVDGVAGDWVPLVTLVRLPRFKGVDCAAEADTQCSLKGADLFLLDSVAADEDFTQATRVPDGFTATALRIPHPRQGKLYIRLRDDPAIVNVALVEVKAPPAAMDGMGSPGPEHLQAQDRSAPATVTAAGSEPATR
ncbi:MAG: hypothetical protein JO184_03465 [Gammaproteobacteria bacterium]|nr:hypothetical protein [Gammaproteobacteria bacterium]